jgi:hypothetical protein
VLVEQSLDLPGAEVGIEFRAAACQRVIPSVVEIASVSKQFQPPVLQLKPAKVDAPLRNAIDV